MLASAFTGQSVYLCLADGSTRRAPLAIIQLECEDINGEYPDRVLETLPEDTLLGNDIVDGERHAYVVNRRQHKLQKDRDAEAEHQAVRTGVKATSVADDLGGHGKDQDQMGSGTQGGVPNLSKDELRHLQETDVTLKMVRQHVVPLAEVPENRVCSYWKQGLLYRKWLPNSEDNEVVLLVQELHQIVEPKVARGTILKLAHDIPLTGHLGVEKTESRILRHYYWPGIFKEVADYCRICEACQKAAKRRATEKVPLVPLPVIEVPFERVVIDMVRPLPRTKRGNRYVLVLCDFATRYPEAIPVRSIESTVITEELMTIFSRVVMPRELLSDQRTNFTSELMADLY